MTTTNPPRRPTTARWIPTRFARNTATSATSACATTATSSTSRSTGAFAHYLDDPYVEPGFTREPLTDEVEVVVIGGGFGGLLAGARLRQAGVESIRMIDPAGDFGGTWYWNRYPGIACDIESYTLPAAARGSRLRAEAEVRRRHARSSSTPRPSRRKFDLYRDACFQTRVEELRWDEASSRWIISTNRGDRMRARFVCLATGPLNRPKLPGIPGLEDVRGPLVPREPLGLRATPAATPTAASPACAASASA